MERYLLRFGAAALFSCLLLASLNLLVDPYGTVRGATKSWPLERVFAPFYPYLSKPTVFAEASPDMVVFGNSRVAYGVDPLRAGWPRALGAGFNYGIPSARMTDTTPYLETVLNTSSPRTIVIGMDYFFDWPIATSEKEAAPREVLALARGAGALVGALARAEDVVATTISITTLRDSFKTVLFQRKMAGYGYNEAGYSPQMEHSCRNGCGDRTAIEEVTRKIISYRLRYLQPAKLSNRSDTNANLGALRAALARAQERGIRCIVVLYPYHVSLLDTIELAGFWPDFQRWKRAIVAATVGYDNVSVLDFSIISEYSTEPVPAAGASSQAMQWYFDPGHFRPELGHRILRSVAGDPQPCPCDALTTGNVESRLARQQSDLQSWRRESPELDAMIRTTLTRTAPAGGDQ